MGCWIVDMYRAGSLWFVLAMGNGYAGEHPAVHIKNWSSNEIRASLPDQSTMIEFAGETLALANRNALLRVGFIPRFGCTPLITIQAGLGWTAQSEQQRSLANLGTISFNIDGTPVQFPTLVDDDIDYASVYFNGDLQRRSTLRLQLDAGDLASIKLNDGETLSFSLMGSLKTLASAEKLCRQHKPDPE